MARWFAIHVMTAAVTASVDPQLLFDRAVNELNAGDYSAAERDLQEVLSTSPQHVGAMQNLGLV